MEDNIKCCLCEQEILPDNNGWSGGNNASPVKEGRCCHLCDCVLVIPIRMLRMQHGDIPEVTDMYLSYAQMGIHLLHGRRVNEPAIISLEEE